MALKDFLEEAAIMKTMKHPNLVQLLGRFSYLGRRSVSVSQRNVHCIPICRIEC